jgi:hypothetical protein
MPFAPSPVSTLSGTSTSPTPAITHSSGLTETEILTSRDPFSDIFGSDDEEEEAPVPELRPSTSVSSPLSYSSPQSDASSRSNFASPRQDASPPLNPSESNSELDTDGSYFNFFLTEISKCFPYVQLFPWTAATLFSTSSHHPALRQSVLSVAALIADTKSGKDKSRALHHLQQALQHLQNKITTVEIDEGVAISSFLLAHVSIMMGEPADARKHLQGKLMVLKQLDPRHVFHEDTVPSPLTHNPLTFLIWRMAIRIDFIASIACGMAPVLPSYASFYQADVRVLHDQDGLYKSWIQSYAEHKSSSDNAEWAEAWFELDGLMHRSCHLALMGDQGHDSLSQLIVDHRNWRKRQVVRQAEDLERTAELMARSNLSPSTTPFPRFSPILPSEQPPETLTSNCMLSYPPVYASDFFVASRLNNWRAIDLHISLTQNSMLGSYDGHRFVCAVDLCRTHAALGAEQTFLGAEKACGLYLAGVIFGGPDMYSVGT